MASDRDHDVPVYTSTARKFHWTTVLLLLAQFPIGLYMTYRGSAMEYVNEAGETKVGLWDATTGFLYDAHKTIGVIVLLLITARLIYRLTKGAPPSDRSLPPALIGVSHLTHWLMYLLLIAIPVAGYLGTSYYGALSPFGIPLPVVTAKDEKFAEQVFEVHELMAFALLALIALHIGAAIYHRFVRKDRIVERMLPKKIV